MQWDASKYAGFTAPDAPVEPWISVNPNHVEINAAEEFDDPDSVYTFYKKLIAMRHNSATISTGEWHLLAADSDQVYAFTRTNGDDTILVVVNLTDRSAALPSDVAELLPTACPIRKYCSAPMMLCIVLNRSLVASSLAGRES